MKVLIIEDEPFARAELLRLMRVTGRQVEVLDELDTVEDSVLWLKEHKPPELIFLDIQLADGISFEIFRQVQVNTPVIFTTAYDEYAIRAFQLNSIDYLLKPVRQEMLENALRKFESLQHEKQPERAWLSQEKLENLLSASRPAFKARLLVRLGDNLKSVEISDVAYFLAEEDVVFVMLKGGGRYIVDHTLNEMESLLDPKAFFRISRNCITSITAIKKVSKYFNSRLLVELSPPSPEQLLVSRVRVPEFLQWMDQ
jgi:two-component system, LytTR family, response regulator LytT